MKNPWHRWLIACLPNIVTVMTVNDLAILGPSHRQAWYQPTWGEIFYYPHGTGQNGSILILWLVFEYHSQIKKDPCYLVLFITCSLRKILFNCIKNPIHAVIHIYKNMHIMVISSFFQKFRGLPNVTVAPNASGAKWESYLIHGYSWNFC